MGYRGTGRKVCSTCRTRGIDTPINSETCPPSVVKKGSGSCRACSARMTKEWRERHPERAKASQETYKAKNPGVRIRIAKKYFRTPKGRHNVLRQKTKSDNRPETDLLNSLNFYAEIIRDNECHYCLGPLGKTSHALDRMDNNIGHLCFNVVPCCKSCNQKKMNDTSYEEMMLLVPALREIRKRREEKRWQQSQ